MSDFGAKNEEKRPKVKRNLKKSGKTDGDNDESMEIRSANALNLNVSQKKL